MITDAVISVCGKYRYLLRRQWDENLEPLSIVMLNPSTADASTDDPTIRRCIGFARREGAGGIVVANLFGLRATEPTKLREVKDPFGPRNTYCLERLAADAMKSGRPIVCGWGNAGGYLDADKKAVAALSGASLMCFRTTAAGMPSHPLYVPKAVPLVSFKPIWEA